MNTILALDTSGPSLSVALTKGDRTIYECTLQNGRTHSERLMPLVDEAIEAGGITLGAVDCFAVVSGPGSFTGVRIGIATAIALAQATEKPCMAVNALQALAYGVCRPDATICALQDARAEQVYAAAYRNGRQLLPDQAVKLDAWLEALDAREPTLFVGDGAWVHRERIVQAMGTEACIVSPCHLYIRASVVAALAQRQMAQAVSWQKLRPYYLRAPQAERERLLREQGGKHD